MKLKYFLYVSLIVLLSFFSFYPAFSFAFIVDDWYQLWGVFYDSSIIDHYIKTQHPNSAYEFLIFAPLYKFNPFYYQLNGFLLKIVDSLAVAVLIFTLTKSKTAAIFSGLIFASSVMGIETFTRISAHNSALLIPTLALGIYVWVKAKKNKSVLKYLISVCLFIITIMQDPGIGIIVLPVIFLWDLLNLIRDFSKQRLKNLFVTTAILISIPILLKWYLDPRIADRNFYLIKHMYYSINNIVTVTTNFSTNIGNLIIGWFIPFKESLGIGSPNYGATFFGYLAIIFTLLTGAIFLRKKVELFMIIFFFSVWVFLFYFPSWFTQSHYVEGGVISAISNRYLAISSIGIIGLISYFLSSIRFKTAVSSLIFILILNIWSANRILKHEYPYRSLEVQNRLYNKIDQDLPRGNEKTAYLLFLGDNQIRLFGLEWNGFYPLAIRRGITDKKEFPKVLNNLSDAKKLLCVDETLPSESKLSSLYAWGVQNNGMIYNVTTDVKLLISKECKLNP